MFFCDRGNQKCVKKKFHNLFNKKFIAYFDVFDHTGYLLTFKGKKKNHHYGSRR